MAAMTPLTYEILLALADEQRHGYGIIKELEARLGPGAAPSTGALYLALQRMEKNGLIEAAGVPAGSSDARRRYYQLSTEGRDRAEAESTRLVRLVASARSKGLLAERA
jgi:DNA-binding PadR family transcriptional regulator